jgi:hypothetical protein
VPDRLASLVSRLLSPNPDDRPQRGQEVATELADIARQYGIESSPSSIAYVLKQLFPSEAGGTAEERPSVRAVDIGDARSMSISSPGSGSPSPTPSIPPTGRTTTPGPSAAAGAARDTPSYPRQSQSMATSRRESQAMPAPVAVATERPSGAAAAVSRPKAAVPKSGAPAGRSISIVGLLITVAVGILLAVGVYLLVRPS